MEASVDGTGENAYHQAINSLVAEGLAMSEKLNGCLANVVFKEKNGSIRAGAFIEV